MNDANDIGAWLSAIKLIAGALLVYWLYKDTKKAKDKPTPKPKSLLDHCYKYFLIISLSILATFILIMYLVKWFE